MYSYKILVVYIIEIIQSTKLVVVVIVVIVIAVATKIEMTYYKIVL